MHLAGAFPLAGAIEALHEEAGGADPIADELGQRHGEPGGPRHPEDEVLVHDEPRHVLRVELEDVGPGRAASDGERDHRRGDLLLDARHRRLDAVLPRETLGEDVGELWEYLPDEVWGRVHDASLLDRLVAGHGRLFSLPRCAHNI